VREGCWFHALESSKIIYVYNRAAVRGWGESVGVVCLCGGGKIYLGGGASEEKVGGYLQRLRFKKGGIRYVHVGWGGICWQDRLSQKEKIRRIKTIKLRKRKDAYVALLHKNSRRSPHVSNRGRSWGQQSALLSLSVTALRKAASSEG